MEIVSACCLLEDDLTEMWAEFHDTGCILYILPSIDGVSSRGVARREFQPSVTQ